MKSRGYWLVLLSMLMFVLLSGTSQVIATPQLRGKPVRQSHQQSLPSHRKSATPGATTQTSGTTIMEEKFEGTWPGDGWAIMDMSTGGSYSWLKRFCVPHTGMYGGSVALAPYGGSPGCSSLYPNNASVAASYGPFNLSSAITASLTFYLRGRTPSNLDSLFVGSSTDGTSFSGIRYSGDWTTGPDGNGYTKDQISLDDLAGQPEVWVTFWFQSNASETDIGFTVDDIALTMVKSTPPPTPDVTRVYVPAVTAPGPGQIVFTHYQTDQGHGIYVINPDGSGKHFVTSCAPENMAGMTVHSCGPTWSPDGKRIAFHSKLDGDASLHLYIVRADGTNLTRLTNDDLANDGFPVWSPNGDQLAFVRNRAGDMLLTASIYTIGIDGTRLTRIAEDSLFWPLDWSPLDQRIAYSCIIPEHANTGLCTIGTDGQGRTIVADNVNRGEIGPAWSSDGRRIAYVSAPFGYMKVNPNVRLTLNMGDLHVVGSDGSGDTILLSEVAEIRGLAWSHNNAQIAFAYRFGQPAIATERSDLSLIETGGTHATTHLTNYDGIPFEQHQRDVDPDWSN